MLLWIIGFSVLGSIGALTEMQTAKWICPNILAVLRNLQAVSQQRHLPAFRRCTQRSVIGSQMHGVKPHQNIQD